MSVTTLISAAEFTRMQFPFPAELVRGEVFEMNRPGGVHGKVCMNVGFAVENWARENGKFEVITNDTGVITERDPDTVRGPDLCIVHRDRLPDGKIPEGHLPVPPEICIEVRSPTDRWSDLLSKVAEYCEAGVAEVWIIDPKSLHLHVYRRDDEPVILNADDQLASSLLPGFAVSVKEFFRGV